MSKEETKDLKHTIRTGLHFNQFPNLANEERKKKGRLLPKKGKINFMFGTSLFTTK